MVKVNPCPHGHGSLEGELGTRRTLGVVLLSLAGVIGFPTNRSGDRLVAASPGNSSVGERV